MLHLILEAILVVYSFILSIPKVHSLKICTHDYHGQDDNASWITIVFRR